MTRYLPAILLVLPAAAPAATYPPLSAEDQAAAFTVAGFSRQGAEWRACDDPGTASYTPGAIASLGDLNGDGLPEALITEGGSFCFGHTGQGYSLVSKQADGAWKLMAGGTGIARFLATSGTGGWPDIEVGGPGSCFPVLRWNGSEYRLHRQEYEGKACTSAR